MGLLQQLFRTKAVGDADAGHGSGGLTRSFGLFSLTMLGVGATMMKRMVASGAAT